VLKTAEIVFYLVADETAATWIRRTVPTAEDLLSLYMEGKSRAETYASMVDVVLHQVRTGRRVCLAVYGHPGVFVNPGHTAIAQARAEGYVAEMLPAVSALDCLFADLGLDPAMDGCQMFEATSFVTRRPRIDPGTPLVLWQAAYLGILEYRRRPIADLTPLRALLIEHYPADHPVVVYEAAPYAGILPSVQSVNVENIDNVKLEASHTLYIPPARDR
jgi:uncharacterized protein YabN with tetrapyrrole methylase and pyrophosphatase domain